MKYSCIETENKIIYFANLAIAWRRLVCCLWAYWPYFNDNWNEDWRIGNLILKGQCEVCVSMLRKPLAQAQHVGCWVGYWIWLVITMAVTCVFSTCGRSTQKLLVDKAPLWPCDAGRLLPPLQPVPNPVQAWGEAWLAQCSCPWHSGRGLPKGAWDQGMRANPRFRRSEGVYKNVSVCEESSQTIPTE